MRQDEETLAKRFESGPLAFVHMLDIDGRPMVDPSIMIGGFALNLAVVVLLALLLRQARPALPSYGSRLAHAALVGIIAVVLVDFGDAVWWQIPWEWKLWQASYGPRRPSRLVRCWHGPSARRR